MSRTHSDLFQSSEIADSYVKYRPTYGSEVFETIINFCQENPAANFSLAVDVGCGSGQSTLPLTKHFQKVIGLDVSEAQISRAPTNIPNLSFRVGPGEDLSFVDTGSVDLVTVATALHWLAGERFYAEVERVLRPGGALVAYCYGLSRLDEAAAQETVVYYKDLLSPYWAEGFQHVEQEYRSLSLPFAGWSRNDSLQTDEKHCSVDKFVGFLSTWSSYHHYMPQNPSSGLLEDVKRRLQAVYQDRKGQEREVKVTWPVFMLMGRKPCV